MINHFYFQHSFLHFIPRKERNNKKKWTTRDNFCHDIAVNVNNFDVFITYIYCRREILNTDTLAIGSYLFIVMPATILTIK